MEMAHNIYMGFDVKIQMTRRCQASSDWVVENLRKIKCLVLKVC